MALKFAKEPPGTVISFSADHLDSVRLTEDDLADDFANTYKDRLRFDHHPKRWYEWDGTRWKLDETERALDYARLLCRKHRGAEAKMASKAAAASVERLSRADARLAVTSECWDRDHFLLGTPKGTVELKTGKLRPPTQTDYITRSTSVSPAPEDAKCPVFVEFLSEVTGGDEGLQRVIQQWAGYSLTADTREEALVFFWGPGGNGKTVLVNVFSEILGDYAVTSAMETFTASGHQRHLTELARLHGARMVRVSETERDQGWAERRIYMLTGNEPVTANYMRQDPFTFRPVCKITVTGNHRPSLSAVNEAAKRRFIIVPFVFNPPKPDMALSKKLKEEYPAILRWMIDGCLDWQTNGLVKPEVVKTATADYFQTQDLLGSWLDECCNCGPGRKENSSILYKAWREYSLEHGEQWTSQKAFGSALSDRGFKRIKASVACYEGIELKPASSSPGTQ